MEVKEKNFDTNGHLFGIFLKANDPEKLKYSIKNVFFEIFNVEKNNEKKTKEAILIRGHGLVTDEFPQKGNRGRHMKVAIQD